MHTRLSPLPFLNFNLVVEACAIILPPIGLLVSLAKLIPEVVKERGREGGRETGRGREGEREGGREGGRMGEKRRKG